MAEQIGLEGHAPVVTIGKAPLSEKDKYEKMWSHEQYRGVSPGEDIAQKFLEIAQPKPGSECIDFGTGTGRGALMLAVLGQMKVKMLDFAPNCLDEDVRKMLVTQADMLSFAEQDLTKPIPHEATYGFCTDVMEHIPPADVDTVLGNVMKAAQHVFFQISCTDDVMGALIGEPLHLSVHKYSWWLRKFCDFEATIHWSADMGSHCLFFVSAWMSGKDIMDKGTSNTDDEIIRENVKTNINAGWDQVTPYDTNDLECMILAGGPSLNEFEDKIRELRAQGVKLITLNGTYDWCLDRGLSPSAQIVVDAREFNKRFTRRVISTCRYLIASQVHPATLEGLPKEQTLLWHTSAELVKDLLLERWEVTYPVVGGSTVMLRALPLMRMLGYTKFHLFGFDSCIVGKDHHAYSQPENDDTFVMTTTVGGRKFRCHPWMFSQAQEFMELVKFMGDVMELEVYGDGLIAHMLKTGAELSDEQD